jgi:hypothetical protein
MASDNGQISSWGARSLSSGAHSRDPLAMLPATTAKPLREDEVSEAHFFQENGTWRIKLQ